MERKAREASSAKDSSEVNGVFQERDQEGRLGTLEGAVKWRKGGGVRSEAREQLEDQV